MNIFRPEVDINIVSSSFTGGYTPLHTAAEINNIQALEFILQVISLLLSLLLLLLLLLLQRKIFKIVLPR